MSFPGDQGPPSRNEWWRPDSGDPGPGDSSPDGPQRGSERAPDRRDRDRYRGAAGEHGDAASGSYQAGGYRPGHYGGGQHSGAGQDGGGTSGYPYGNGGDAGSGSGGYGEPGRSAGAFGEDRYRSRGYETGGYKPDSAARGYGPSRSGTSDSGSSGSRTYGSAAPGYGAPGYGASGSGASDSGSARYRDRDSSSPGHGASDYSSGYSTPGSSRSGYGTTGSSRSGYGASGYGASGYGSGRYGPGGESSGGYRSSGAREYGSREYGSRADDSRGYNSWRGSSSGDGSGGYGAGDSDGPGRGSWGGNGYGQPDAGYDRPSGGYRPGGGYRAGGFGYDGGGRDEPGYGRSGASPLPAPTAANRDPARGFPPRPGAGAPEYPPGQFSPWNAPSDDPGDAPDTLLSGGAAASSPSFATAGFPDPGPASARPASAAGFGDDAAGGNDLDPWNLTSAGQAAGPGSAASTATSPGDRFGGESSTVALADAPDSPGWGYSPAGGAGTEAPGGAAGAGFQDPDWAYSGQGTTVADPGEAWPAAPAPRTTKRRAARPPRSRRKLLIGGMAVLLLVAALGGTAVYALNGHGKPVAARSAPPTSAPSRARPSPSPTLGKWQHIATRAADPAPLTVGELYPEAVSSSNGSYDRAAGRMDTNCAHALFGTALKSAAKKSKCTQVARASYVSSDGKLMGTIGVLNLVSYQAATKVGKVVGSNEFIGPLAGSRGPTRSIAKGTGLVQAEIKGHYLILTWAEYANLHQPSKSHDRTVLVTFSNDLIQLTANRSLTNRMVTGQPRT